MNKMEEQIRVLESKVNAQKGKIQIQSQAIDALLDATRKQSQMIERLQSTVFQVIGSKFDQNTESEHIFSLVNFMYYGNYHAERWLIDADDDGTDKYLEDSNDKEVLMERERYERDKEEHIRRLEEEAEKEDQIRLSIYDTRSAFTKSMDQYCQNLPSPSSSTHSSEEDDEAKELCAQSVNSVAKRIQNSAELCGNN